MGERACVRRRGGDASMLPVVLMLEVVLEVVLLVVVWLLAARTAAWSSFL